MAAVDKNTLLNNLENQVEKHLQLVIYTFQNLPAATLLLPSVTNGWSIAQCLQHLNAYGYYYLPAIENGLTKNPGKPDTATFTSTWLGRYFTHTMDPATNQKKYKAFKAYNPPPDLDAYAVVAEFIQQQETLLSYLKKSRTADLNVIKIPVSIASWLKLRLGDVLQFVIAHNQRHLLQAQRNLA